MTMVEVEEAAFAGIHWWMDCGEARARSLHARSRTDDAGTAQWSGPCDRENLG